MKEIEVPFDIDIRMAYGKEPKPVDMNDAFKRGVYFGIAYANQELERLSALKRPFLSDEEITLAAIRCSDPKEHDAFDCGARYVRDRYEEMLGAVEDVKPWVPEVEMKCAFWFNDTQDEIPTIATIVLDVDKNDKYESWIQSIEGVWYDNCALIETLDEIGKPPAYFINRGRCTVSKDVK